MPAANVDRVKKVRVSVEMEVEINLSQTLGDMSEENFLAEWRKSLWEVDSLDDIYKHAAEMVAAGFKGYHLDGLGLLSGYASESGTVFRIIDEHTESEIV